MIKIFIFTLQLVSNWILLQFFSTLEIRLSSKWWSKVCGSQV